MVNYWFTVHGPHPKGYHLPWDIYLQDTHEELAKKINKGDQIFFYELKGNGKLNKNNKEYKTDIGRMGIVHVGNVTGERYKRSREEGSSSSYGESSGYWSIGIPTDAESSNGFVSRDKVVSILGYKENYYFRGLAGGAGIRSIDASQAFELLRLFKESEEYRV